MPEPISMGAIGLLAGAQVAGGVISNLASSREASKNRAFQKEMSNTSHSREVADLRNAGLNPILSAHKGASTPVGAISKHENVAKDLPATVLNSATAKANIKLSQENIETQKTQQALNVTNSAKNVADTAVSENQINVQNAVKAREVEQANLNSATAEKVRLDNQKKRITGKAYEVIGDTVIPVLEGATKKGKGLIEQGKDWIKKKSNDWKIENENRKKIEQWKKSNKR